MSDRGKGSAYPRQQYPGPHAGAQGLPPGYPQGPPPPYTGYAQQQQQQQQVPQQYPAQYYPQYPGQQPQQAQAVYPQVQQYQQQYYQAPPSYSAQQNTYVCEGGFDAGARFPQGNASIPPPPPGCMPNAAQMAAANGHQVVVTQRPKDFWTGGSDGGYVVW